MRRLKEKKIMKEEKNYRDDNFLENTEVLKNKTN
jgi:hypothetical protein